jgi:hypothetical protein
VKITEGGAKGRGSLVGRAGVHRFGVLWSGVVRCGV